MADPLENIANSLRALANKELLIGVPESETKRKPPADTRITNAAIGYVHERGCEMLKIPARPHLLPGVQDAKGDIVESFKKAALAAVRGELSSIDQHLMDAGEAAQTSVKGKIQQTLTPPIKPESLLERVTGARLHPFPGSQERRTGTLRRQYEEQLRRAHPNMAPAERRQLARRQGQTMIAMARNMAPGVQPLYDTGDYVNSIRYVVRNKGWQGGST